VGGLSERDFIICPRLVNGIEPTPLKEYVHFQANHVFGVISQYYETSGKDHASFDQYLEKTGQYHETPSQCKAATA
jgi:hypothetical protein